MICLDASVAVKLVLPEEFSDETEALLRATVDANEPVVAPALLPIEVANIIRKRMVQEGLALDDARQTLERFLDLPIDLRSVPDLHLKALTIADALSAPATYDAYYLAIALDYNCDLWTDDRRLLRLAGSLPFVRWIGDFRD